ncbi:polysaccharide deacetylase family protein [Halosimplex rubrum]|uniref:Polysaccharide deacetylase family protein n=1 Tax=Halosimplex rubrum TaxID=869889 RepID=A0A7D5TQ90_9EURY|nr:polysaccharide deacetylase family protein [Halosimplex rubrum]QLH78674.1 polysaccharide deacetylase family protein [Halosimplex rubrum]
MANDNTNTTDSHGIEYPAQGYDSGSPTWAELYGAAFEDIDDLLDARPTDEAVKDIVAALVGSGDKLSWTYDDGNDTLTLDTTALDEEEVEDTVNALVTAGNALTASYDDDNDQLTIAVDESAISHDNLANVSTGDHRTDEQVRDLAGGMAGAGLVHDDGADSIAVQEETIEDWVAGLVTGGTNVSTTYNDANDQLTVDTSALNEEEVEDAVAALLSSSSNLAWNYDDGNDALTISLSGPITGVQIGTDTNRSDVYADTADANVVNAEDTVTKRASILEHQRRSASRYQSVGRVYDNLSDLSNWSNPKGSLTADTSEFLREPQSALVEPNTGESAEMRLDMTDTLGSGQDWTNINLSATIKIPDGAGTTRAAILLRDYNDIFNYFWCQQKISPEMGWLRLNVGIDNISGSPSIDNIGALSIILTDDDIDMRVDHLQIWERPATPQVILTFDDGDIGNYTDFYPEMDKYGFRGCISHIVGEIGDSGRMDLSQMRELQSKDWDMCSEGWGHNDLTTLSDSDLREDIRKSRDWLLNNGFHDGARFIHYPYGNYDETVIDVASDYHMLGRTVGSGNLKTIPPNTINPFVHRSTSDPAVSEFESIVDRAITYNYTTVFNIHPPSTTQSDFASMMSYLDGKDDQIEVITWTDYLEQQAAIRQSTGIPSLSPE